MPAGRKSLLERPSVRENLLTAIGMGLKDKPACQYAGISPASFYAWQARAQAALIRREETGEEPSGEDAEGLYLEFLEQLERARAQFQLTHIANITQAARGEPLLDDKGKPLRDDKGNVKRKPGDWRASAWLVERRHPDEWGEKSASKVTVSGKQRLAIEVGSLKAMSPDQLAALADEKDDGSDDDEDDDDDDGG